MIIRLYVFAILTFTFSNCFSQEKKYLSVANDINKKFIVSFFIDDKPVKIKNNFKVFFINGKDTLKPDVKESELLLLPGLFKDSIYTIVLNYNKYCLSFNRITQKMIFPGQDVEWRFGIDNPPFNSLLGLLKENDYKNVQKFKQLQYLQLMLMEYGDGVQFVNTVL
jgi:hypothetical protein